MPKVAKHGRWEPKDMETAVEANENGDVGLHGVYLILCHKVYPERTLRWEELCCSGKNYAAVGRTMLQWEGLCCSGKNYAAVGRIMLQWEELCCSGKNYAAVGRTVLQWEATK